MTQKIPPNKPTGNALQDEVENLRSIIEQRMAEKQESRKPPAGSGDGEEHSETERPGNPEP